MTIENFYALTVGEVPSPFDETFPDFFSCSHLTLRVVDLGQLVITSGLLEVSDPFVGLAECKAIAVPSGSFPVYVTIADVSRKQDQSHEREAYLSVIFREGDAVELKDALDVDGEPAFVVVDAGTVAFCDHAAARSGMPAGVNWYEEFFDEDADGSWFNLMDSPNHISPGVANIPLPLATGGENVVLTHSGWGDGYYAVNATYNAAGDLLGIHIDLQVVDLGPEDEEDE